MQSCVGVGDDKERGGSRTNYLWWKERGRRVPYFCFLIRKLFGFRWIWQRLAAGQQPETWHLRESCHVIVPFLKISCGVCFYIQILPVCTWVCLRGLGTECKWKGNCGGKEGNLSVGQCSGKPNSKQQQLAPSGWGLALRTNSVCAFTCL